MMIEFVLVLVHQRLQNDDQITDKWKTSIKAALWCPDDRLPFIELIGRVPIIYSIVEKVGQYGEEED